MSSSLLATLRDELELLVAPIVDAVEDVAASGRLLRALGAGDAIAANGTLLAALAAAANLRAQIDATAASPEPSFAGIAALLKAIDGLFVAVRALDHTTESDLERLGTDIVELLSGEYLRTRRPLLYRLGTLFTLVDPAENTSHPPVISDGKLVRAAFPCAKIRFDRLSPLVNTPEATLKAFYMPNGLATVAAANAAADALFPRIGAVLSEFGVIWSYGVPDEDLAMLGTAAPFVDHAFQIYLPASMTGSDVEAGITFTLSSDDRGGLGLVIGPFGSLGFSTQVGSWKFDAQLGADVEALAIGKQGATFIAGIDTAAIEASFTAALVPATAGGPAFVFGSTTGTRLELGTAKFGTKVDASASNASVSASAAVSSGALVIASGDGDSFISAVLPAGGLRATFDVGVTYSTTGGLAFSGGAGLDTTLPIGLSIGGVFTVPTVHLAIAADDAGVSLEVSASIGLSIGPVRALVDRVGFLTTVSFPSDGGNLGVADLDFQFKWPSGVGLEIDSAGVSGGGFLQYFAAKREYDGVLQLQFSDFALQAFALITTEVAGGSGYSLLALVDAEFAPIQLGWGFTLDGVGGIFAAHRTADVDALGAALKADTLGTILFPKHAVTNAPQIIAQLDTMFPTAHGRFLFGPMALIGWGTPTLLTIAVAIILELPEPVRVILLARIAARLPSEAHAVVKINVDALGVLDLSQHQLSLDATLYDSHIVTFAMSGDMALRANWGAAREFVLAVGGFHPQFTPPPGFPTLKRISIDMPSRNIAKLRLAAYIAITSNSVQFGADLDVFIGVGGFGLSGHLGFDALLQWNPFQFQASISATVALVAGSDDLMSVELNGNLRGPGPWTIAGSFKMHVLFFDVSKSFTYSWGVTAAEDPIAPVDMLSQLTTAIADTRNWGARLPPNVPPLVSTRASNGTAVVAHPLAQIDVHETVVPLGLQIERVGAAPLTGANTFSITDFHVGGSAVPHAAVQEDFAPAQFFNLTDTEKLARPAFERHDAGVATIPGLVVAGPSLSKTIAYETMYVDTPGGALRSDPSQPRTGLFLGDLQAIAGIGASARAEIRAAGALRFQTAAKPVSIAPLQFVVAGTSTLIPAGVGPASGVTYGEAAALMSAAITSAPARAEHLQIVATYEMAVA